MVNYIVAAAVILDGDRVLITQRKKGSNQELKWEFPGGKVEDRENPEQCIIREIKEELNMDIVVQDIFKVVMHTYVDRSILLLAYLCRHTGGDLIPLGCKDFSWISVSRLMQFDLAEADIPVAVKLWESDHH